MVALCDEEGETICFTWPVDIETRLPKYSEEDIKTIQSYTTGKYDLVFHNAEFDILHLQQLGIKVNLDVIHDTMIAARIVYNAEFNLKLKPLAWKYLRIPADDEEDLKKAVDKARRFARQFNRINPNKPPFNLHEDKEADYWLVACFFPENKLCETYCRKDTYRTSGLYQLFQKKIQADPILKAMYENEKALWRINFEIGDRGLGINRTEVVEELDKAKESQTKYFDILLSDIENQDLKPFFGKTQKKDEVFNPNSSQQLSKVLYNKKEHGGLELKTSRKTDAGNYSTDKYALEGLMWHPFVQHLQGYRDATQAINLFLEKYLALMVPDWAGEHRLHPGLNQCGTLTYRWSCSSPNLQQVTNEEAQSFSHNYSPRKPFGPRKGYCWYGFDYSKQELQLTAMLGNVPFFLQEMKEGRDVYAALANKVFGGKTQAAFKAAAQALELGSDTPSSKEIESLWALFGWDKTLAKKYGYDGVGTLELAERWLQRFVYDIVTAEKSIGKKTSRQICKQVLLSKSYGAGVNKIAFILRCKKELAQGYVNTIDSEVPELGQFLKRMATEIEEKGFIINPYGYKLRVDSSTTYQAANYYIQSTAACMMKKAVMNVYHFLKKTRLDAHIIMPIHDELILEIKEEHCYPWLLRGISLCMEDTGIEWPLPFAVEVNRMSESWAKKETIDIW